MNTSLCCINYGPPAAFHFYDRLDVLSYVVTNKIPVPDSPYWNGSEIFYVGIPKTASSSIIKHINHKYSFWHMFASQYPRHVRQRLRTIVRNPFDRLVSAYHFIINGGFNHNPKYLEIKEQYSSFEDWVLRGLHEDDIVCTGFLTPYETYKIPFLPQVYWILDCDRNQENPIIVPDHIGRFENLYNDCQRLLNITLTDSDVSNPSPNRNKDWKTYYTNVAVRDKVVSLYRDDFLFLKYSTEVV